MFCIRLKLSIEMKEKLNEIFDDLRNDLITVDQAREKVTDMYADIHFFSRNEIPYSEIIKIDFTVTKGHDKVHFDRYGFKYRIFHKDLTPTISASWDQVTRRAQLIRVDNEVEGNIVARMPIQGLEHLKKMIGFYAG